MPGDLIKDIDTTFNEALEKLDVDAIQGLVQFVQDNPETYKGKYNEFCDKIKNAYQNARMACLAPASQASSAESSTAGLSNSEEDDELRKQLHQNLQAVGVQIQKLYFHAKHFFQYYIHMLQTASDSQQAATPSAKDNFKRAILLQNLGYGYVENLNGLVDQTSIKLECQDGQWWLKPSGMDQALELHKSEDRNEAVFNMLYRLNLLDFFGLSEDKVKHPQSDAANTAEPKHKLDFKKGSVDYLLQCLKLHNLSEFFGQGFSRDPIDFRFCVQGTATRAVQGNSQILIQAFIKHSHYLVNFAEEYDQLLRHLIDNKMLTADNLLSQLCLDDPQVRQALMNNKKERPSLTDVINYAIQNKHNGLAFVLMRHISRKSQNELTDEETNAQTSINNFEFLKTAAAYNNQELFRRITEHYHHLLPESRQDQEELLQYAIKNAPQPEQHKIWMPRYLMKEINLNLVCFFINSEEDKNSTINLIDTLLDQHNQQGNNDSSKNRSYHSLFKTILLSQPSNSDGPSPKCPEQPLQTISEKVAQNAPTFAYFKTLASNDTAFSPARLYLLKLVLDKRSNSNLTNTIIDKLIADISKAKFPIVRSPFPEDVYEFRQKRIDYIKEILGHLVNDQKRNLLEAVYFPDSGAKIKTQPGFADIVEGFKLFMEYQLDLNLPPAVKNYLEHIVSQAKIAECFKIAVDHGYYKVAEYLANRKKLNRILELEQHDVPKYLADILQAFSAGKDNAEELLNTFLSCMMGAGHLGAIYQACQEHIKTLVQDNSKEASAIIDETQRLNEILKAQIPEHQDPQLDQKVEEENLLQNWPNKRLTWRNVFNKFSYVQLPNLLDKSLESGNTSMFLKLLEDYPVKANAYLQDNVYKVWEYIINCDCANIISSNQQNDKDTWSLLSAIDEIKGITLNPAPILCDILQLNNNTYTDYHKINMFLNAESTANFRDNACRNMLSTLQNDLPNISVPITTNDDPKEQIIGLARSYVEYRGKNVFGQFSGYPKGFSRAIDKLNSLKQSQNRYSQQHIYLQTFEKVIKAMQAYYNDRNAASYNGEKGASAASATASIEPGLEDITADSLREHQLQALWNEHERELQTLENEHERVPTAPPIPGHETSTPSKALTSTVIPESRAKATSYEDSEATTNGPVVGSQSNQCAPKPSAPDFNEVNSPTENSLKVSSKLCQFRIYGQYENTEQGSSLDKMPTTRPRSRTW